MTPSNQEIIAKYHNEILELKKELVVIYQFDNIKDRRSAYSILSDLDYEMLVKGYKHRKHEAEITIRQRYNQIGRLAVKE